MNARTYFDEPHEEEELAIAIDIVGDVETNTAQIYAFEVIDPEELHGLRRLPERLSDLHQQPGYEAPETARFQGVFPTWHAVVKAVDAFVAKHRCRHQMHPLVRF